MNLAYGVLLLFLLVVVELSISKFLLREKIDWLEITRNLNSGHILLWIFRGLEVFAFSFFLSKFSLGWVNKWPIPLQWLFAFVAWDFSFYWLHRFHHKFGLLWSVHAVHHAGEHFDLSLGIRNSWYSSLTSFPFFIGIAVLGVPLELFVVVSSIHYFIQFYNHNSLIKKKTFLDYIFVTPTHHKVHHGKNDEYIDKNFGGTFVLWDKLFGTFQTNRADIEIIYGVQNYVKTGNPIMENNLPFLNALRIHLPFLRTVRKYNFNAFFVALGAFIQYGLLVCFISNQNTWSATKLFIFFWIIFSGTLANGGLADGNKWGAVLWLLLSLVLCPVFVFTIHPLEPDLFVLTSLFFLHGVEVLRQLIKRRNEI